MNKTLLINSVNPQDFTNLKKNIFFLIGDLNIPEIDNKLINLLNKTDLVDKNDIVFKYNGVELNITVQTVPEIIKLLIKEDLSIYSVFQTYNPDFY